MFVLDGCLDLRVSDRTQRLAAGDSAAFTGDLAHGYATPADAATPARFALTRVPARRRRRPPMTGDPRAWLAAATIECAVFDLHPDYRAVLLTADGLHGGPSDRLSEGILAAAEHTPRRRLGGRPAGAVAAPGRVAGGLPRLRPSRSAPARVWRPFCAGSTLDGLARIDRTTNVYNAVSIAHLLPLGGEEGYVALW